MKRPDELDDPDRDPMYHRMNNAVEAQAKIVAQLVKNTREEMWPASKRIPSPYTNAPRPITRNTDGAMVAFCCFAMIGAMLTLVGGVTMARWIWEAVR